LLSAHLEAFGASRVGRSGVKFDRLGKTTSGQPIFSVDEETANDIRATFIIDLALLRSYGRGENGLKDTQKQLLLDLALWKIKQLLSRPFRYRTQCFLGCETVVIESESGVLCPSGQASDATEQSILPAILSDIAIDTSIKACGFVADNTTRVDYPAEKLYKAGKDDTDGDADSDDDANE
jgi:CRISPR-associated protein Csb1